jgi:pyruvate-formate lyase-activating enzyme
MKIAIKGIYHERTEDAPFIGALICADNCKFNCKNCINDELKYIGSYFMNDYDIINEILFNKFNKGIILAGLEWTLQPKEMLRLIELALINNLQVILYTGMSKNELFKKFPELFNLNIYIKCGKYIEDLHVENYKMYNVKLASSNQEIIKVREYILNEN